jgi:D-serine deaminase-like pyridoxal phosphate-dependent protein
MSTPEPDLLPIDDEDMVDRLAWALRHEAKTVQSLIKGGAGLEACRRVAELQLEHLKRSGLRAFRLAHGPGTYRP